MEKRVRDEREKTMERKGEESEVERMEGGKKREKERTGEE